MKIVLATKNRGKVKELASMLRDMDVDVCSIDDVAGVPEIVEDGSTFFENAFKKAKTVAEATGLVSIGDDSGLEVDALDGAPGVYSARFSGAGGDDEANNRKLLDVMKGIPDDRRTARFRCVVVAFHPSGRWISAEGTCEGMIGREPRGTGGFGYDPVFVLPSSGLTMAEISREEKNRISHRGEAFRKIMQKLREMLEP